MFSPAKGGRRADLDNRYFRSRWEANWARYLNWQVANGVIVAWEYEVDTYCFEKITRGNRFYTPDFKIFENDGRIVYHEVKGWMDASSKTKLKRMQLYYPNIIIRLIDKPVYTAMARQMRPILKDAGWEYDDKQLR